MGPRLSLALLSALVLLAGCDSGSGQTGPDGAGSAVPWTSQKPPEVAERAPVATPCTADDLAVQGQVKFAPRLQGGIALVPIRNAGGRTCRLTGRPGVKLVKDGGPMQVQRPIPPTRANFPEVTYPDSSLLALRPGESGAVTITWDNWCDPVVKGRPHVPPSAVRITLPAGRGRLEADYNAVPRCLDPNAPTAIGVSEFQPSLIPPGPRWSDAFLRASVPGQPVHGRRGELLRFRVVLTNALRTAVDFDRCPDYAQQLAPSGEVEVYELNCPAAGSIAPGKSVAFSMQVRVPQSAPVGGNGLFWELDPFGAKAPQVHARVTVDG